MSKPFEFACPSCAAPGRARAEWAGRAVRCKHCKATFTLPAPGEAESDAYELAEPVALVPEPAPAAGGDGLQTTFAPAFRDAPLPEVPRDMPRRKRKGQRSTREELLALRQDRRVRILAGLGIAAVVLTVASFLPGIGLLAGPLLTWYGTLLIAVGFLVGAYAAFREDLLYGFAYVVIPIYTGYYLVTRFDDLWPWFSASTIGFVSLLIGSRAVELAAVA